MHLWVQAGFTPNQCSTTACALGWATTIPEFHAAGLRVVGEQVIAYAEKSGYEAAMMFFGLDRSTARYIFSTVLYEDFCHEENISPADVADRIEDFLRCGMPDWAVEYGQHSHP